MDLFQYDFMQRAFAAGVVIGIICPLAGIFLVLRRLSLVGDALSHISLAGVSAGLLLNINATVSAMVFAAAGTMGIEFLRRHYEKYAELAIALTMSAGMATAVLLISLGKGSTATVMSFLFGSIVAVTTADVQIITIAGFFVLVSIMVLYKYLFFIAFDEEGARLAGIPVNAVNIYFTLMTAVTIAVSMRIVGILLVSSLMTIPAAISLQIAGSFRTAAAAAVVSALISIAAGLILSFHLSLAPGGAIILFSLVMLLAVMGIKRAARAFIRKKASSHPISANQ